jgi:hypothetical protein
VTDSNAVERVIELISMPPLNELVTALGSNATPALLKSSQRALSPYTPEEIGKALDALRRNAPAMPSSQPSTELGTGERPFREREHQELVRDRDTEFLVIQHLARESLGADLSGYFQRIALVPKLKETRVHAGFSRVVDGGSALSPRDALRQMWRDVPENSRDRWLPAYQVYGEGIFLQLDEKRVRAWETQLGVRNRVRELGEICAPSHTVGEQLAPTSPHLPRLILVHSLAHALMREFVVSCGYSMAALRERLYVAHSSQSPMTSVLIYTASGDSAGSLGGLVRLGSPEYLGPMLRRALARARWCAADPVCMEAVPEQETSTRESANLAACHNCMFVPETSCEEFNGFLDRALLVGTHDDESIGYFDPDLSLGSVL